MADLPGMPDMTGGGAGSPGTPDPGMGFGNLGGNSWLQGLLSMLVAQNPGMAGLLDKAGVQPPAGLTGGLASAGAGGTKVDLGNLMPAGAGATPPGEKAGTQPYEPPNASGADGGAMPQKVASTDTNPGTGAGDSGVYGIGQSVDPAGTQPTGEVMPGYKYGPSTPRDLSAEGGDMTAPGAAGPTQPGKGDGQMSPAQLMALAAATGTVAPKPIQPITSTGVVGGHVPYPAQFHGAQASAPALSALISALVPGGLGGNANPLRVPILGSLLPRR